MKTATVALLWGFLFSCLSAVAVAQSVVHGPNQSLDLRGTWRLADVYCSNPNYVMSPDEQAFRDAIHHKGDFWTDDVFTISAPSIGVWRTDITTDGLKCATEQDVQLEFAGNHVYLKFMNGRSVATDAGTDPNKSINCSAGDDAEEDYFVEVSDSSFDFYSPAGPACGEFHFHFLKLK